MKIQPTLPTQVFPLEGAHDGIAKSSMIEPGCYAVKMVPGAMPPDVFSFVKEGSCVHAKFGSFVGSSKDEILKQVESQALAMLRFAEVDESKIDDVTIFQLGDISDNVQINGKDVCRGIFAMSYNRIPRIPAGKLVSAWKAEVAMGVIKRAGAAIDYEGGMGPDPDAMTKYGVEPGELDSRSVESAEVGESEGECQHGYLAGCPFCGKGHRHDMYSVAGLDGRPARYCVMPGCELAADSHEHSIELAPRDGLTNIRQPRKGPVPVPE